MARIMKLRVVPRGYVRVKEKHLDNDIRDIMKGYTPSGLFMAFYNVFGNPQAVGQWSYMIRHNNVVMRITYDGKMSYEVWLSPGYIQDAKRKLTKVMNVIARRLNEEGVVFIPNKDIPDALYYPIRKKNEFLMKKGEYSVDRMNQSLTDEEKGILYGGLTQFIPEVRDEIASMIKEIAG